MKIYDLNLTGGAGAAQAGRAQETDQAGRTGSGGSPGAANAAGDRVEFSSALGRLSEALATYDTSRAMRVAQLAEAYRSGQYQPDAAATSRAMVSEALAAGG
jgi:hypothetical protein